MVGVQTTKTSPSGAATEQTEAESLVLDSFFFCLFFHNLGLSFAFGTELFLNVLFHYPTERMRQKKREELIKHEQERRKTLKQAMKVA